MYIVYKHTAPNGKCYIGMTCQTLNRRTRDGKGYAGCSAFENAITKYGWENFSHEILEEWLTFEEACEKEKEYIRKFKSLTTQNGYNLEAGGRAFCEVSAETREKISRIQAGRERPKLSEEAKEKIRQARIGKKSPPRTEEHCRKLSEALTGRHFTEAHCRHISESKAGTKCGASNHRARKVLCVDTGEVFDTIKAAGEYINVSPKNIIHVCAGRMKTSGGYHWKYVDEEV